MIVNGAIIGLKLFGKIDQINKDRVKATIGAIMYVVGFALLGWIRSFRNNFIASARGWVIPINVTLFGPLRRWI